MIGTWETCGRQSDRVEKIVTFEFIVHRRKIEIK